MPDSLSVTVVSAKALNRKLNENENPTPSVVALTSGISVPGILEVNEAASGVSLCSVACLWLREERRRMAADGRTKERGAESDEVSVGPVSMFSP